MSDALQVFVCGRYIPRLNDIIMKLKDKGLLLEGWDTEGVDSLNNVDGFWPGLFNGSEAGFEFCMAEVDDDDLDTWGVNRDELESRNIMMELCYYTEQDLVAAVLFIQVMCDNYNGLTFDENDKLNVTVKNSEEWKNTMLAGLVE